MIAVIVPHARPDRTDAVLEQIAAQTLRPVLTVVVCNGPARDVDARPGGTFLRCSKADVAAAMNTGLDYLRRHAGQIAWCKWDDDDQYGPGYLAELWQAMTDVPSSEIFGKRRHWAVLSDGIHLFNPEHTAPGPAWYLAGPTLAARTLSVPAFREGLKHGSDLAWLRDCHAQGLHAWSTGPNNFIYSRGRADHVWNVNDTLVRWTFGESMRIDGKRFPKPSSRDVMDSTRKNSLSHKLLAKFRAARAQATL